MDKVTRRKAIRRLAGVGGSAIIGCLGFRNIWADQSTGSLRVGFPGTAPHEIWKWSKKAEFYERHGDLIFCHLCPHECVLRENDRGFCRVRVVKNGELHSLVYGNPCSLHVDPIEKKPLFHFLPGTDIISLATAGCNLRCINCQNWEISQVEPHKTRNYELWPQELATRTVAAKIPSIAYTYSEPIVFYEYMKDAAEAGRQLGLRNVMVSAGYIKPAPLQSLSPSLDAANIDIKTFNDYTYRKLSGGLLAPVLRALKILREQGVWLEITRLIVPTLSDDIDDITRMCDWLVRELGDYTPLHLARYFPAYQLRNLHATPAKTLEKAYTAALKSGLKFVYVGNHPEVDLLHTVCPECKREVIKRQGYSIQSMELSNSGQCPCGAIIKGVWQ